MPENFLIFIPDRPLELSEEADKFKMNRFGNDRAKAEEDLFKAIIASSVLLNQEERKGYLIGSCSDSLVSLFCKIGPLVKDLKLHDVGALVLTFLTNVLIQISRPRKDGNDSKVRADVKNFLDELPEILLKNKKEILKVINENANKPDS